MKCSAAPTRHTFPTHTVSAVFIGSISIWCSSVSVTVPSM